MAETFSNQAVTTLSAAITTVTATSCTVADASRFPTTGNFRIKIDNEIMVVTAVATNTFTVTRAQESTTAQTHASGANIIHLLTKGGLEARVANRFVSDLYANKPTAGVKGRLFLPTDGLFMEYDDGAMWHKYGPYKRLKAPPATGWNWFNQGNATATFMGSALVIEDPDSDSNATQIRSYVRPLAAGTTRITAAFFWNGVSSGSNYPVMGICGQTVGGTDDGNLKLLGMRLQSNTSSYPNIFAYDYTSYTGTSEQSFSPAGRSIWPNRICWIRWEVVGTKEILSWSHDGVNWVAMDSTRTIGAYAYPTKWGVFIDPTNNVMPVSLTLVHWEEG